MRGACLRSSQFCSSHSCRDVAILEAKTATDLRNIYKRGKCVELVLQQTSRAVE